MNNKSECPHTITKPSVMNHYHWQVLIFLTEHPDHTLDTINAELFASDQYLRTEQILLDLEGGGFTLVRTESSRGTKFRLDDNSKTYALLIMGLDPIVGEAVYAD